MPASFSVRFNNPDPTSFFVCTVTVMTRFVAWSQNCDGCLPVQSSSNPWLFQQTNELGPGHFCQTKRSVSSSSVAVAPDLLCGLSFSRNR
jgi:hypothetical protein